MSLRVRFAPSPTGFLHVGGARTALFNWLLARKEGGAFVLRIEDTDRERSTEEHRQAILDGLRWLGLGWDEGPFFQSEGAERHRRDAETLLEAGLAYRDFSTPEETARDREEEQKSGGRSREARRRAEKRTPSEEEAMVEAGVPHTIRFRVPDGETVWEDAVHGTVRFRNEEIDDLVILRADRTPTYNLAVVSDDAFMRINLVLRGDDHLSNTPKQILLYRAMALPEPRFGHVPLILGPDGRRLSKRHGATAIGEYRSEGILPEAMVNFLALLGWSPGDDREVFTREELVQVFSLERVLRKSSVFDPEKLRWLNGQHLVRAPLETIVERVREELARRRGEWSEMEGLEIDWPRLVELLRVRARTTRELLEQAKPFLAAEVNYDEAAVERHWLKDPSAALARLRALGDRLAAVPWSEEPLERAVRGLAEELGVGAGKVIHPLRVALTGTSASPPIFDVLILLGRERSLERLERGIRELERRSG